MPEAGRGHGCATKAELQSVTNCYCACHTSLLNFSQSGRTAKSDRLLEKGHAIMKSLLKAILISVLILAGVAVSGAALARHGGHGRHGGHAHFGLSFGFPLFGPAYYPYYAAPYYQPPYYPPLVLPYSPPVYIEQGSAQPAPAPEALPQGWWYYCAESNTYYPYVNECPGGWQRVAPRPPNS